MPDPIVHQAVTAGAQQAMHIQGGHASPLKPNKMCPRARWDSCTWGSYLLPILLIIPLERGDSCPSSTGGEGGTRPCVFMAGASKPCCSSVFCVTHYLPM
ncbi:hypothetical protein SKAU_G00261760 [Synaphobranchus kaupii]|uniref:Uncharacterized protein n=1 Tax=Synaphobranchus kaupii TaxID=118154 RepID=A0A9Q1EYI5_SYNKA|nr:hypothetical protein SKAU_G00261760 [Synaphobranchus kaupii]